VTVVPLPGDFELTHINGDVGTLIRFGQWLNGDGFADYEHARLYLGGGLCVEAEPGGARLSAVSANDNVPHVWSTGYILRTDSQRAGIVAAGHKYVGVPYSFADYEALAAKRLHLWVPGLNAYVRSSGHMICSQLVAKCEADAGCPLFGEFTGDVTPGDLLQLLASHGYKAS
jgi:hypothetical protein